MVGKAQRAHHSNKLPFKFNDLTILRTSYHIENKIDLALSSCQTHKEPLDTSLLDQLKKRIELYNEYPGPEREAIQQLLAIGYLLIKAIYHSAGTPALHKDFKSTQNELFKNKPELLSHPDAKALIELVATEKAYFNFKKSKKTYSELLFNILSDDKYNNLFSKPQSLLKDAFEILRHLLFSLIKGHLLTAKDDKGPPLIKDLDVSVILPIKQKLDYRLSDGGCVGYSMVFLQSLLNQQLPFGVKALEHLPYHYISDYIFVNHLARFNLKIANAYTIYNSYNPKKIAAFNKVNNIAVTKEEQFISKAITPDHTRKELIQKITQVISQNKLDKENIGIHFGLTSLKSGHSLACYPDKTGFHLLDANIGWLYFKKQSELFIFLDRLLKAYESHAYNCINVSQYISTQVLEKTHLDFTVKTKNPTKLFSPISSRKSSVAGTLFSTEKNFPRI